MIANRISNRVSHQLERVETPVSNSTATIHLVQSTRFARRLANILLIALAVSVVAMGVLPWQQTSRGSGAVVAFDPQERQQTVRATAKGVVKNVWPGLVDGARVKKDQILMEIEPFAGDDLRQQREFQLKQLTVKKEAAEKEAAAIRKNIKDYTDARDAAVSGAERLVEAARDTLESKKKDVDAKKAKEVRVRKNYERQKRIYEKGYIALKKVEKLQEELDVAVAELAAANREVDAKQQEFLSKQDKVNEERSKAQTKIDYAIAQEQKVQGNIGSISKDIADLEIKLKELRRLVIAAPRDGTVFRLNVNEQGDTVKEGDALLTIIPDATQKAVQLFVVGNDMPLVQVGQEVRLQFEGWPAVQFAGWPSVAVGTFSGKVATVDATDNGKGEFRILVTPNSDSQEWPSDRYLRQGVRVNGWVMLRQVSLGYEIWRQLNGFPVIVADKEPDKQKGSKPKLPK